MKTKQTDAFARTKMHYLQNAFDANDGCGLNLYKFYLKIITYKNLKIRNL